MLVLIFALNVCFAFGAFFLMTDIVAPDRESACQHAAASSANHPADASRSTQRVQLLPDLLEHTCAARDPRRPDAAVRSHAAFHPANGLQLPRRDARSCVPRHEFAGGTAAAHGGRGVSCAAYHQSKWYLLYFLAYFVVMICERAPARSAGLRPALTRASAQTC